MSGGRPRRRPGRAGSADDGGSFDDGCDGCGEGARRNGMAGCSCCCCDGGCDADDDDCCAAGGDGSGASGDGAVGE